MDEKRQVPPVSGRCHGHERARGLGQVSGQRRCVARLRNDGRCQRSVEGFDSCAPGECYDAPAPGEVER